MNLKYNRQADPRQSIVKPAHLWTPDEVHDLVMETIGVDDDFPRGYQVLVLLYSPPLIDEMGMHRTDKEINSITGSTMVCKILRMGDDAFMDEARFPTGATVTFGEWVVFRGSERQRIRRNGKDLAYINDDRFLGKADNPSQLETTFDVIHEFVGI
jgi:hypothetical protein